jgi:prephenate dehydratase
MKNIAYLGGKGSYSYLAGMKQLGHGNYVGCSSFQKIFERVDNGTADCGVLPIENSLVGSIYENYDRLHPYDFQIIAEEYIRIEHCLLTVSKLNDEKGMKTLRRILSHPKAIEQCSLFLQKYPWIEPIAVGDTASAAFEVASKRDETVAAIASAEAARIHHLFIEKRGIADDPANVTRFVIVAKKRKEVSNGNKATLFLILNHRPGSLAVILQELANRKINLTKIESRPYQGHPFEYLFYIDIEFEGKNSQELATLLEALYPLVKKIKLLGYYSAGSI